MDSAKDPHKIIHRRGGGILDLVVIFILPQHGQVVVVGILQLFELVPVPARIPGGAFGAYIRHGITSLDRHSRDSLVGFLVLERDIPVKACLFIGPHKAPAGTAPGAAHALRGQGRADIRCGLDLRVLGSVCLGQEPGVHLGDRLVHTLIQPTLRNIALSLCLVPV